MNGGFQSKARFGCKGNLGRVFYGTERVAHMSWAKYATPQNVGWSFTWAGLGFPPPPAAWRALEPSACRLLKQMFGRGGGPSWLPGSYGVVIQSIKATEAVRPCTDLLQSLWDGENLQESFVSGTEPGREKYLLPGSCYLGFRLEPAGLNDRPYIQDRDTSVSEQTLLQQAKASKSSQGHLFLPDQEPVLLKQLSGG